ncbi:MAG: tRNA pseudouridine(55) synthase TruB [Candidatus Marinimicrobia bacterium CG08_land_8_20_14_0_20_45_22]|nr:MAG: tRNA pseudouridine(55) synthase TruB [Candidatus Marinimicrobia bacterium CG08_land_8_20_14_0_20_45_22]
MTTVQQTDRILNVYKPAGISSYDVVRKVKRLSGIRKIGHGGTLDPFAEGVLLVLMGQATKRMIDLLRCPKTYECILKLGQSTKSGDPTTSVVNSSEVPILTPEILEKIRLSFLGEIDQTPPRFSAKKIDGQRAYKLARRDVEFTLKPKKIMIYDLKPEIVDASHIQIVVTCSSGTYIRKLGEDFALALGTVGHLIFLKRVQVGDYRSDDAISFDGLDSLFESAKQAVIA